MMRRTLALTLFLALAASPALAQKMRDFSAPLSESLKREDTPNSPTGFYDSTNNSRFQYRGISSTASNDYSPPDEQAEHYLDGYCDPNFTPIASRNRGVANCMKQQKEAACSQFARMPKDVKKVLYLATDCAYEASENGGYDEDSEYTATSYGSSRGCAGASDRRLQLAKKYWDKEEVVEALVFLPDAVLGDTASCINGSN